MNGLRDAFQELVADVPVHGDLDRAIEQVERERRQRYGVVAGLAAAAAVVAVIVGVLAVTRDGGDSKEPIGPSTPTPTETQAAKSQSPRTWVDTPVTATDDQKGWDVPDPLDKARDAWFAVVTDHLDPTGGHLRGFESSPFGVVFERPDEGSIYPTYGRVGLIVERSELNLFDDGCRSLLADAEGYPVEQKSCSTERFAGPHGEHARISRYGRVCGWFDGSPDAYPSCGEYRVAVAVERRDGLIGYLMVDGRGMPEDNPFTPGAMAAVAADPRITLPETAMAVPPDRDVAAVVESHFPRYRPEDSSSAPVHPGYAQVYGSLGRRGLSLTVRPAGADPSCGRSWLVECAERRVYGAEDPTTVFVGIWDEDDWADCCPRNSRADSRELVYVGPRHTVVVSETLIVRAHEEPIGADLDQRLIDLALDPRLQ